MEQIIVVGTLFEFTWVEKREAHLANLLVIEISVASMSIEDPAEAMVQTSPRDDGTCLVHLDELAGKLNELPESVLGEGLLESHGDLVLAAVVLQLGLL